MTLLANLFQFKEGVTKYNFYIQQVDTVVFCGYNDS